MSRQPRFEICVGDGAQPWWGRAIAGNGKEMWRTSETYTSREGAERAILRHARIFWRAAILHKAHGLTVLRVDAASSVGGIVVRFVDERHTVTSCDGTCSVGCLCQDYS